MERRRLLAVLGGSVAVAGCTGGDDDGNGDEGSETDESDGNGDDNETDADEQSDDPDETAGTVPPNTSFDYDYSSEERTVRVRMAAGDPFDPSRVSFLGSVENAGQTWLAHPSTPDNLTEVTAGDGATLSVETESGDPDRYLLELEWVSDSGENSVIIGANTGPDRRAGSSDPTDPDEETTATEQARAYLEDNNANNYDDSIVDMTGSDSATVRVGGGSIGLAFDPAALRVSPGTTVTWEWTGMGGAHNVKTAEVPEGGQTLDSGQVVAEEGHTYSETLNTPGTYRYYCNPHRASGMHGAIVVE
jgi:halocyanin-like protein